ncbi:unnamed protein product [Blepharisma stoltei]|uniref:Uncharacterized protein n=1 Tax=Blepharisma stoltei TaxID=1481888 RepID=A0AAU9IGP8_9CILI|nr:unnamed protein product [Blepharisma stoltei]
MTEPEFGYDNGNFWSDLWMTWVFDLISYWNQSKSKKSNIVAIPHRMKFEESLFVLEKEWEIERKSLKPNFFKALKKTFWWEITKYSIYIKLGQLFGLLQAVIMIFLIDFFTDDNAFIAEGIILVACLAILSLMSVSLYALGAFHVRLLTLKIKSIVPYIIYKKVLKTSYEEISNRDFQSKLPNTIAADMENFNYLVPIAMMIGCPFIFASSFFIIGILTGWAGIIGLTVLLVHYPIAIALSSISSYYRKRVSEFSDKRIMLITNLIEGIKVVKLYGWEDPFLRLIYGERSKEIKEQEKQFNISSVNNAMGVSGIGAVFLVTFALYIHLGNTLELSAVFCVVAVMMMVYSLLIKTGVVAAFSMASILLSMERITQILLLNEKNSKNEFNDCDVLVSMVNASFSYKPKDEIQDGNIFEENLMNNNSDEDVLTDINFQLRKGELMIVVGQVGSGKTSLLLGLLNEIFLKEGNVNISGKISYSGQDSWVLPGTIKENILMGNEYNEFLYKNSIKICGLDKDLDYFKLKDEATIGDNGAALSGGQKARLSLARALYSNKDIMLLDDPLSAVDAKVSSSIFKNCIKEFLKDHAVILISHHIHLIPEADKILVLSQGKQIFFGEYQEFQERHDISHYVGELNTLKNAKENWDIKSNNELMIEEKPEMAETVIEEENDLAPISLKTYYKYFSYGFNSYCLLGGAILWLLLSQLSSIAVLYWLTFWFAQVETEQSNLYYVWFYAIIICINYVTTFLSSLVLNYGLTLAGKCLHNKALENMCKTNIQFFDKNSIGKMINRFSKDTFMMDEILHTVLCHFISQVFDLSGILISIAIIVPPAAALVIFYFLNTLWFSQFIFPMIKDLTTLALESKGPILSLANASIHGIATIRSHNLENKLITDMKNNIEYNCRCELSKEIIFRFYQFYMEIFTSLLCIMIAIVLIPWKNFITPDLAAICICFLILAMQTSMSWADCMLEIDILIISPQRLMEYADLQQEGKFDSDEGFNIKYGKIEFKNIFMKYGENYPYALHDLNFAIYPGEKVGIVGRTGSGKSSIMNVLFRIINPTLGTIFIDDQDYKSAGLHQLRKQMSAITQSPIIFMASFRDNIDPYHEYTDDEIWRTCKQADLYDLVKFLPNKLDTVLLGPECSLSAGEKQLVCLARALIRNSKIVMMDEATANVDPKTDRIVHKKIKTMFPDSTMLIIAHRLRTIINVDLVIVMEDGTCKEIGRPKQLINNKNSLFRSLILHTGPQESEYLLEKLKNN